PDLRLKKLLTISCASGFAACRLPVLSVAGTARLIRTTDFRLPNIFIKAHLICALILLAISPEVYRMTDSKVPAVWPQAKFAFELLLFFSLVAGFLSFSRLSNSSFGAQGDLPVHYHLMRAFNQSLTDGDWLPHWAGLLDGGRGDAFFTFYPPLFYWLTSALARWLHTDIISALKIVSFFCLLLAQINAYFFARVFF